MVVGILVGGYGRGVGCRWGSGAGASEEAIRREMASTLRVTARGAIEAVVPDT